MLSAYSNCKTEPLAHKKSNVCNQIGLDLCGFLFAEGTMSAQPFSIHELHRFLKCEIGELW